MENSANPQSDPSDNSHAKEETSTGQAKPQPQWGAFDSLLDAIHKGAEDARTAAEKAVPKVKSAAAGAVYWTAYGVSFATVFQWTLAKGLTPESLRSGFHEGVRCGAKAAEKWIEKLKRGKEQATGATPDPTSPSPEAAQPGPA
jgi:hypothetical protein